MLGVGSHSDPPRLPYDHAHHRLRAPSQCVLLRIAAERAALLYSKIQHKTCCIGQYSALTVCRAHCIAMQQCSAMHPMQQCSNTSQYSIQHNALPLSGGEGDGGEGSGESGCGDKSKIFWNKINFPCVVNYSTLGCDTPSTDGKSTPLAGQLAHTLLWAGVPKLG